MTLECVRMGLDCDFGELGECGNLLNYRLGIKFINKNGDKTIGDVMWCRVDDFGLDRDRRLGAPEKPYKYCIYTDFDSIEIDAIGKKSAYFYAPDVNYCDYPYTKEGLLMLMEAMSCDKYDSVEILPFSKSKEASRALVSWLHGMRNED